jgi:site-specific recombinase XerD
MAMDNPPEVRHEFLPEAFDDKIRENLDHVESTATKKAHASDWREFTNWCSERALSSCPADPRTVAGYISDLASSDFAVSTISRRLATISVVHRRQGFQSPTGTEGVKLVLKGIRNRYGTAKEKKLAIRVSHIRQVPAVLPDGIKGIRDFALILVGYTGAFRRSELVALDVADLDFVPQGVRIALRRSKTDQAGEGRVLDISYASNEKLCPVHALKKWLVSAQIEDGPVFRGVNRHGHISGKRLNDRAVAEVIKEIAEKIGLDPEKVGGHSLRAGFVTDGLAAGLPTPVIRRFSGHKSEAMLAEYYREACLFNVNVTSALGL